MRISFRVALLSATLFAIFLTLGELACRQLPMYSGLNPLSAMYWQAQVARGAIQQSKNEDFVTDAHGILVAHPFTPFTNSAGYRTPEFTEKSPEKARILFVGDSFTWGLSAEPLANCFVDRMRLNGFDAINLGIPATGPAQYAAQAGEYVPRLRPDAVCVMLYIGNDLFPEADVRPGLRRQYQTDAGMLAAVTPDGRALSFEEAVALRSAEAPAWLTPAVARVLAHSALGRFAAGFAQRAPEFEENLPRVLARLESIWRTCETHGTQFLLFLIPALEDVESPNRASRMIERLAALSPVPPPALTPQDFAVYPDSHLNNAGHAVFAEHIGKVLRGHGLPGGGGGGENPWKPLLPGTLDELATLLGLNTQQRTAVLGALSKQKLQLTTIYSLAPAQGKTTPMQRLAAMEPAETLTDPLSDVALAHTPTVKFGTDYLTMRETLDKSTFRTVAALLPPEMLATFKRIPPEHLRNIATGFDPLGDELAELRRKR